MKKTLLSTIVILWIPFLAQAQDGPKNITERKHEIKIGSIKLLAGGIFETTYEYIHTKDVTFGASALVNFDTGNGWHEDYSLTPFVRFYFQETREYGARGFFLEAFGKVFHARNYTDYYTDTWDWYTVKDTYTATALGISLGKKWVNSSGFSMEILIGGGRVFGAPNDASNGIFRGDLNIGYRF